MDLQCRNVLALAYVGDSVYEIYIRKYLFNKGIEKVQELQKEAIPYVSAKGQSNYLEQLLTSNILTEEEIRLVNRARNHKSHASPKHTDVITYHRSTGLEALIGYLYLKQDFDRIDTIMNFILYGMDGKEND